MLLPTIRRWLAVVVMSLLLVTMSLPLTATPRMAIAQGTSIELNHTSGPPGSGVIVSGRGYKESVLVRIYFNTFSGPYFSYDPVRTDSRGNFRQGILIPKIAPGLYPIWATDGLNRASTPFTVT